MWRISSLRSSQATRQDSVSNVKKQRTERTPKAKVWVKENERGRLGSLCSSQGMAVKRDSWWVSPQKWGRTSGEQGYMPYQKTKRTSWEEWSENVTEMVSLKTAYKTAYSRDQGKGHVYKQATRPKRHSFPFSPKLKMQRKSTLPSATHCLPLPV